MALKKFEVKNKPNMISVGDTVKGADKLAGEPNKTPKEKSPIKDGKQTQVKEVLTWSEYLDGQGKLIDKPKIELVPDAAPSTNLPPVGKTSGKNWNVDAPKADGKPEPYSAPAAKGVKTESKEKGLQDMTGDKPYEPDTKSGKSKYFPGGTTKNNGWESKTESFLDTTKGMSIGEFAEYMLKKEGCKVTADQPYAPITIRDLINLTKENKKVLNDLVYEIKRNDLFDELLSCISEVVGPPIGVENSPRNDFQNEEPTDEKEPDEDELSLGDEDSDEEDDDEDEFDDEEGNDEDEDFDDEEGNEDDQDDELDGLPTPDKDEEDRGNSQNRFRMK